MTILNATDRTQDTWLDGYGNEPTRGLDLPAKHEMWSLLLDLAAREQVTTFSAAVRRWRSEASAVRSA